MRTPRATGHHCSNFLVGEALSSYAEFVGQPLPLMFPPTDGYLQQRGTPERPMSLNAILQVNPDAYGQQVFTTEAMIVKIDESKRLVPRPFPNMLHKDIRWYAPLALPAAWHSADPKLQLLLQGSPQAAVRAEMAIGEITPPPKTHEPVEKQVCNPQRTISS